MINSNHLAFTYKVLWVLSISDILLYWNRAMTVKLKQEPKMYVPFHVRCHH
jgi:hypothetical protein